MNSLQSTSDDNSSGIKLESKAENNEPLSEMEFEQEFESKKVMNKTGTESKTDIVSQLGSDADSAKVSEFVDRLSSKMHSNLTELQHSALMKDISAIIFQKRNKKSELDITTSDSSLPVNGNGTDMRSEMAGLSELNPALGNETVDENQKETVPKAPNPAELLPIRMKRFSCEYCGMFFSKISNHRKHLLIHTGEKPFKCDECDAAFTSKSNMNIHMRLHTGEKPFQCELCDAAFVQKCHLLKHRAAHASDKQVKCEFCSATFADTAALLTHKEVHNGETPPVPKRIYKPRKNARRPHKCEVCGLTFIREAKLIYHARIHTGVKPHKCTTCSATFSKRGSLTIHTRIHTGEKPFTCQYCNAAFSQKGSLTVHQKVHRDDYWTNGIVFPDPPPPPKPAKEPEPVKMVPETQPSPNSPNSSKMLSVKDKLLAKVLSGGHKIIQSKVIADNVLDPVNPISSDFKTSKHQRTNAGKIATPIKPANEPEPVKKVTEKKCYPNPPNTSEMTSVKDDMSAKVISEGHKKIKLDETAENVFALDPVDPIFTDFITSMHQRANAGEIATDSLFQ